jgi:calcineurin-like phosphoesterase family protein
MEILKGYPNIFFRSDDHLDHEFFIKGIPGQRAPRPMFTTVEEMNECIISRHNERVRKGDLVYDLGDIFLKTTLEKALGYRRRMNGQFFAIKGNHDQTLEKMAKDDGAYSANHFDISPDYIAQRLVQDKLYIWYRSLEEINLGQPYFDGDKKQLIALCHYAMRVWKNSFHGSWHLYGHSHGMLPEIPESLSFDVGVDCWDFYPVSIEEIKAKMATKMPAWEAYKESLRGSGRVE